MFNEGDLINANQENSSPNDHEDEGSFGLI